MNREILDLQFRLGRIPTDPYGSYEGNSIELFAHLYESSSKLSNDDNRQRFYNIRFTTLPDTDSDDDSAPLLGLGSINLTDSKNVEICLEFHIGCWQPIYEDPLYSRLFSIFENCVLQSFPKSKTFSARVPDYTEEILLREYSRFFQALGYQATESKFLFVKSAADVENLYIPKARPITSDSTYDRNMGNWQQ